MQELRPSAIGGLGGASSAVRTDALDESLAAQKIYLVAEPRSFEAFCSPKIGWRVGVAD